MGIEVHQYDVKKVNFIRAMVCSDMVWIKATINLTVQLKERLETP